MSKANILEAGKSYTFRSYFEMTHEPDEILSEFGYELARSRLSLPQTNAKLERLPDLCQRIEEILPFISLSSEAARRETLVSPILLEVVRYCQCQLRIEYALNVDEWLKGTLDYLLRSRQALLVIEAKNDDLTRGFTQLAVELIALARSEEKEVLYGAVTIGDIWQFGQIDRRTNCIVRDIDFFRVPTDLELLVRSLVGILQAEH